MRCTHLLAVALLLVCGSTIVTRCSACDESNDCMSCTAESHVETAAVNAEKIQELMKSKQCQNWGDLKFKTVAISMTGGSRCRTFDGLPYVASEKPKCAVAEPLEFAVNEELSVVASSPVIDDLARDGQFECEPNGAMVFNRGRVRFLELDTLFQPWLFRPSVFTEATEPFVGIEVILSNELIASTNSVPGHWCHKTSSAFLIFYDVVDGMGRSILSDSA